MSTSTPVWSAGLAPGDNDLLQALDALPLIDHHVHGATTDDLSRLALEELLTESDRPIPSWMTVFDSQVGFAVRRWCSPVLGLPEHASAEDYLRRRHELWGVEVTKRLLQASGIGCFLLETGFRGDEILDPAGMQGLTTIPTREVVRIESVMEAVALEQPTPGTFMTTVIEQLQLRMSTAVGLKSIIAYRFGFDFDPVRPSDAEVQVAAGRWLSEVSRSGHPRVSDPVLLRAGVWAAADMGVPLQLHTGYGDPDLDLHRCDPLLLTNWLRMVEGSGMDVLLLHCYPFQRNAGYLAQVFPHVYVDVGLGINYTGSRSPEVIAESIELAPFAKVLFSSDAWGPAELHYLGALWWRRGMYRLLHSWVQDQEWCEQDAVRVARMMGAENAARVYRLSTGDLIP
ncbi:MAG: amidohydrolase family protein [Actinomycetales bacterium]